MPCARGREDRMSVREELEVKLHSLRNKRDELEDQMRKVTQLQEEERYHMISGQRKLEQMWNDYGEHAPELESMLEEENAYIENFKLKFEEHEEKIQKEYNRQMEEIDKEVEELQAEIYESIDEVEKKEGDTEDDRTR